MEYEGHVLRSSSGLSHLQILEGHVEEKRKGGRPKRIWMEDILDWTNLETYDKNSRGKKEMETHSCQPSFRRRLMNE
jgi:hypothetical protein